MHFMLELFQNADDNLYNPSTTPKMKITYRNGTLRFDTNEIGFRKTDVEAICSIGHSSKMESQPGQRQIGEKGIGFKSVFRVSGSVFIASGHYSFMFTDKEPLGRLTPTWARFPEERLAGFTSIFLQLHPTLDFNALIQELNMLDGKFLMFLQNLKEVEIEVFTDHQTSNVKIRRYDAMSAYNGLPCRHSEPDASSPYILFRYPVSNLPPEPKRKGRTTSEIVLAFPSIEFNGNSSSRRSRRLPILGTHKVYAFLPVRDYGFRVCAYQLESRFIIHVS
jgi:hypothetical protein